MLTIKTLLSNTFLLKLIKNRKKNTILNDLYGVNVTKNNEINVKKIIQLCILEPLEHST